MFSFFIKKSPAKPSNRLVFNLIVALSLAWMTFGTSGTTRAGAKHLDVYSAVEAKTTTTANLVGWESVGWESVGWQGVGWESDY